MPTPRADGQCDQLLLRRGEAAQLGFGKARVDSLLRSGRWHAPVRGILATEPGPLSLESRCRAAVLGQRRPAVVSHLTATVMHGLPVLGRVPDLRNRPQPIDLILPPPATTRQPGGLRLHWPHLDPVDTGLLNDLPLTSVARSILDVARRPELGHWAIVLADAAIGQGLICVEELFEAQQRIVHPGHRQQLGRLLTRVDGRARSPQETVFRLTLVDAGLPVPLVNWPLYDDDGLLIAIGDLVYDDYLLWLEYDGFAVHGRRSAFRHDRTRERLIRSRGFEVIRVIDEDIDRPRTLARMVRGAIDDAPRRIALLPGSLSREVASAQARLVGQT